jgi:Low psii accumulation1 / Rep27
MSQSPPKPPRLPKGISPEKYARLRAEAAAPYLGFRRFIYLGAAASGSIGGFIFFFQVLAGRNLDNSLPNLALQLGVVALMLTLYRFDGRKKDAATPDKPKSP